MSHQSIYLASIDEDLRNRTAAAVNKEAFGNEALGDTPFGQQVKSGSAAIGMWYSYAVAVDTEAAYESALAAGNQNPGGDPSVITDAALTSAVQAHWPELPTPPPTL